MKPAKAKRVDGSPPDSYPWSELDHPAFTLTAQSKLSFAPVSLHRPSFLPFTPLRPRPRRTFISRRPNPPQLDMTGHKSTTSTSSAKADAPVKGTSWLSRSKSNAKAGLQRLGNSQASSSNNSSSTSVGGVVGAASAKLTRVVSRGLNGAEKEGSKGKEREQPVAEQDEGVVVDEKVRKAVGGAPEAPKVILGAVEDSWQMYRCALAPSVPLRNGPF